MKPTSLVILFATALLSARCATNQATLTNSAGQKCYCQAQGYGIISSLIANSKFSGCVEQAQTAGYRP